MARAEREFGAPRERQPVSFSRAVFGQRVAEFNVSRHHEIFEVRTAMGLHLLRAESSSRADHISFDRLAEH
jgi:hypothetical protein